MSISTRELLNTLDLQWQACINNDTISHWSALITVLSGYKMLLIHTKSSVKARETLDFIWSLALERMMMAKGD